ncbi:MAG TPA: helix-turn-helix transcriptional regulator [Candidatus Caccovivens faecavium]|nr:helix-turn-helix transcriptional regulator [Candidatus Caccovivens faecavium]
MDNKLSENRKFLINRMGYFRVRAKLSARDLSLRMGKSPGYINKFEAGGINLPVDILFDIFDILNVSKEEFFSQDPEKFEREKKFIMKFRNLSKENQDLVYNIMESLK